MSGSKSDGLVRRAHGFGVCSNTDGIRRLANELRRRHPMKTAEHVEDWTGVPAGTVRKWLSGQSAPSVFAFAKLVGVYGPEVITALYAKAPAWLDADVREARAAALDEQIAALQAAREGL